MADEKNKAEILDFVRARLVEPGSGFEVATSSFRYLDDPIGINELADVWAAEHPYSAPALLRALKHIGCGISAREKKAVRDATRRFDELPRDDQALRRWLRLLERPGTSRDRHEASVFVMKQWIWQVKQAIARRKPRWHVCPIFWSREQGTGKSFNVLRILKPIDLFTRHLFVDALDDQFGATLLTNTYVAFLDEFAGAERVNPAKLKGLMSGKEIQQRGMHTTYGIFVENRISFIGTSNEDPPHGLEDLTGARRLWSIHCSGNSMQSDVNRRAQFDQIDVAEVWACVGTDDPCPHEAASPSLLRYMDTVREDDLRSKSSLESFVEEMCIRSDDAPPIPLKEFRELATRYAWETKQPAIKGSYEKFANLLRNLDVRVAQPKGYWYVKGVSIRVAEAV